jgi:hypothetical protein
VVGYNKYGSCCEDVDTGLSGYRDSELELEVEDELRVVSISGAESVEWVKVLTGTRVSTGL